MAKVTIKRLGFGPGRALSIAKALWLLVGPDCVSIVLHGPWQTVQGCQPLPNPSRLGTLSWDETGFAERRGSGQLPESVRPAGPGCTVDIIVRIEREEVGP